MDKKDATTNAGGESQPQPDPQAAAGSSHATLTAEDVARIVAEQVEAVGQKTAEQAAKAAEQAAKKAVRPIRAELGKLRKAAPKQSRAGNDDDDDDDGDDIDFGTLPQGGNAGMSPTAVLAAAKKVERAVVRNGFGPVLSANPELEDSVTDAIFERIERGDTVEEATAFAIGTLHGPAIKYFSKNPPQSKDDKPDTTDKTTTGKPDDSPEDVVDTGGAAAGGASEPNGVDAVPAAARKAADSMRESLGLPPD